MNDVDAILLLGPTGAGKSPLGDLIERQGLWGRPCRHFDFGRRLRRIVSGENRAAGLSPADVKFLSSVLDRGVLLEDEQFYIAEAILRAFIGELPERGETPRLQATRRDAASTVLVLNGLPRHVSQARDVDRLVRMRAVVHLSCSPQDVLERIRTNVGGDREGRGDDDESAVRRRLEIYGQRIAPLDEHYRSLGVDLVTLTVGPADTPRDVWCMLNAAKPPSGIE